MDFQRLLRICRPSIYQKFSILDQPPDLIMSDFLLQTRLLLNSDYFCLGAIYFDGFTIKIAFKEIPPYTIKSLAQNANIGYHIVLLMSLHSLATNVVANTYI